jgi:glucosamine-6-phosphate deaminase
MKLNISETSLELAKKAAAMGAESIKDAIRKNEKANIILATGASQLELLKELVKADIDWSKVTCFHLDEYVGIDETHPASFRKYLKERFVKEVGQVASFHFVEPGEDPSAECERLGRIIGAVSIDTAFVGIGENSHLAFNDPPADFLTQQPFIVVSLDDACRAQQYGEGWFASMDDVPSKAISMSIRQIMKSSCIIVSVPDQRKARAVKCAVEGPVDPRCPSSILQQHENCTLFLDQGSAALLM